MAVYVDNMRAPYGRMSLCHMIADSSEELYAMAEEIGVAQHWVQEKGTYREHFDVSLGRRARAIERGAIPITMHDLAVKLTARRRAADSPAV